MNIKIYFNNKPLFLCDEMNEEILQYAHHDDAIFIDEFSTASVNSMIHEMRLEKVHAGIFMHRDLEQLKKAFWRKFLVIHAGGGVVLNEKGDFLFIYRRGKWDLPKGKLDPGETIETCAIREVQEETGLKKISLGPFMLSTYHTYDENGKHILKESHWYRMGGTQNESLTPQLEEQITELKWVNPQELHNILENTYPSVREVMEWIQSH